MVQNTQYVRAYASRYRDMFPVRIAFIIGITAVTAWIMGGTWAANFAAFQLALCYILGREVRRACERPGAPGADLRLKRSVEIIIFLLAVHTSLFVLAAWRQEPNYQRHLLLLIGANLMVGALQVHISRLSFAAAVVPPSLTIVFIAWTQVSSDKVLLTCITLFLAGVVSSAWRQAMTDRQTVNLFVDLTERSEALARALADAEAQRAKAERASQAKSRFLAMISHEVRTPLNVMLGITEVLKRRKRRAAEAELVADMADAGGMLLRLLNGALDLSKIESGHADVQLAPVDVRARVEAVARVWRLRAEELNLALSVECDGNPEDFHVLTDEARIEQVIINFLSNALKMTPAGTIRIVARARPAADGSINLNFEVHDQGPGVPADQRERIFQPFEQLENGRAAGGAGLGLAICRASVEALGGAIGMRPAGPTGSIFWFSLSASPVAAVATPPAEPIEHAAPRLAVLAAEDHPANRKLLALLLEPIGVELTLVENGAEAVAAVRTGGFDLVLMDAMMPVLDGVEAVRAIRAEEAATGRGRLAIHMLTANVFDDDVARYQAAGADGVLKKPIEIEALHALLTRTAAAGDDSAPARLGTG